MKKLLVLLLSALFLTACGGNENASVSAGDNKTTAEPLTVEKKLLTATFENGVLENEKYSLTISKSEVIQSPFENHPGLFVTFELTNKTENEEIIPDNVLIDLKASQENETSRVELNSNYHFLDAFGEDVTTYNEMVRIDNASRHALLPGKTVEFSEAYTLNNDTFPVNFSGIDVNTFEEVGSYTVELK